MSKTLSIAVPSYNVEKYLRECLDSLVGQSLQDIEILPDALGCPQVRLTGHFAGLARERGIAKVWISLSHTREYATAQCVMEETT